MQDRELVMRKLLVILSIIILSCNVVMGQPADFSASKEAGRTSSSSPTSGLYSYNPRVEGEYFCIDLYARRYTEWPGTVKVGKYTFDISNHVGAFDVSLDMMVVAGGLDYQKKFEAYEFVLAYSNFDTGEGVLSVKRSEVQGDIPSSTNRFSVSYVVDVDNFPVDEDPPTVQINVPFYLGTLKLKIKAGLPVGTTSGMSFSTVAASLGMWHTDDNETAKSSECVVLGYLDGKSFDIPLVPEAPSTKPETPLLAGDSPVCPGDAAGANYTITSLPKNATKTEWWISENVSGSPALNNANNICAISPNADFINAKVLWYATAMGKTYYVCVKAINGTTSEESDVATLPVQVTSTADFALAVKKAGSVIASPFSECGGTSLTLEVPAGTTELTWTGVTGSGNSCVVALANTTNANLSKTYSVSGKYNGCPVNATVNVEVKPQPQLYFDLPLVDSYKKGQKIQTTIKARTGGPLTDITWTSPADINREKEEQVTFALNADGNYNVAVSAENAGGCSNSIDKDITVSGGISLALTSVYGNTICTNGTALLQATVSGLGSSTATYLYKWYKGQTATGIPIYENTTAVADATGLCGVTEAGWYTVWVSVNGGDYEVTKSLEITNAGKTAIRVNTVSPLIAATPDQKVVLIANPASASSFAWKWTPDSKLDRTELASQQYPLTAAITEETTYQVYMKDNSNGCVASGTVVVKPQTAGTNSLALAVEPKTASLCQGNTVRLKATLTGGAGTGPAYEWTPDAGLGSGANTANPLFTATGISVGTYNYIVKATKGTEVVTSQVTLTVSATKAPSLRPLEQIYCLGNTLTAVDNNGTATKYNWTIEQAGKAPVNIAGNSLQLSDAGKYTVKVVGKHNEVCTSDTVKLADIDLRQVELAQVVTPEPEFLEGETITSVATAANGWGPYTYKWTSPLPVRNNTVDGPDTYTVTGASAASHQFNVSVEDFHGCKTGPVSTTVTRKTGGLTLTADTMYAYCDGGMVMLQAKAGGGTGGYDYEWRQVGIDNILATTATYLVENPGTESYEVTVKDHSSPQLIRKEIVNLAEKKISIKAPLLTTPGTITIASGQKAMLSVHANPVETARSQWRWELVDDLNSPVEATKQFAQTKALTGDVQYKVYTIDKNYCLSKKEPLNVKVATDGSNFDIQIDALDMMCATAKQTLGVTLTPAQTGELKYSWTSMPDLFGASGSNEANPEIQPTTPGAYVVVVTVENTAGVKNTAVKTIEVSGNQVPVLAMDFKPIVCEGDTVTVTPNMGIKDNIYTWYVNGAKSSVTGNKLPLDDINGTNQIVKVLATADNGCVGESEETHTINARPTLAWNPVLPAAVEIGETVDATVVPGSKTVSDYTYKWVCTPTGTATKNVYRVTPQNGDTKLNFTVVATDNTTTCKSKLLPGEVKVNAMELTPTIVMDGLACVGGSAVMRVTDVTGDPGPFTYEWTATGNPTVLSTTATLVVDVTSTTAVDYTVKVQVQGGDKKGVANQTITGVSGKTVPKVIACDDITIPINQVALLTANATGTKPFAWTWAQVADLKSPAEEHLQSPYTRPLNTDTEYKVWVKDQTGCISKTDQLKVLIKGSDALNVEIVPDMELCLGNNVQYRAVVTDNSGYPATVTTSEWKSMNGFARTEVLQATYKAQKAGTDTIVVVVSNGSVTATAKKVITIKPSTAPTLNFIDLDNLACAGQELGVNASVANKGINWIVSKDNGAPVKSTGTKYTFASAGKYQVKVVTTTENCVSDTLTGDITIAPIPQILAVNIDSTCNRAKVVAITEDATKWKWNETDVNGTCENGIDSIRYYKTTEMSKNFSGSLEASNEAGCKSAALPYNGMIYSLPVITLDPKTLSVYPNTQVNIGATLSLNNPYSLEWNPNDLLESGQGTKTIKTKALAMASDPYEFTLVAKNTADQTCETLATATISVDDKDFQVRFEADVVDVCQGVPRTFIAEALNNKFPPLTYTFTSDYPGFTTQTSDKDRVTYTFNTPGTYELQVEASNANPLGPDVRTATVTVQVNPTPALDITAPGLGGTYSLCEHKGEIEVNMNATAGTGGWTVYYRLDENKKQEAFATANHVMTLTTGGEFYADSIVDSKGCKRDYSADMIGFTITDDVPRLAMTSTDPYTKCKGSTTDLNIQITNAGADYYPLKLSYKEGPSAKEFVFTDASTQFASTYKGTYTLVSITSQPKGCTYTLNDKNQVTVNEYTESVPELTLKDKNAKKFCEGESVSIPVKVTAGKPGYMITYTLNGVENTKQLTVAGDAAITVSDNGPLVITKFADANGCGTYTANETVDITKNEKPALAITTSDCLLCGGSLDLGLKFDKGTAPYVLHYTVDGGVVLTKTFKTDDGSLNNDKTALWNIVNKGTIALAKVVDQNGCEVAGAEITGGPTIVVDSFRLYARLDGSNAQCATADARLKIDFAGTRWNQVVGRIKIEYEFEPIGGGGATPTSVIKTKAEVETPNSVELTGLQQGTYRLLNVTDLKEGSGANSCSGILPQTEAERTVSVIKAPVVEIDSMDFAVREGETFVLGIKDLKPAEFDYSWQLLPDTYTNATAPDYKMNGTMGTTDMKYVLKGTNKDVTSCFNTDTINVYKIPEAPALTIDTNRTRYDLILKWTTVEDKKMISGYQMMHNKWDAYAIEKPYSEKQSFNNLASSGELSAASLDTLEFFYLRAMREIKVGDQMRKYYSLSSDTVGYMKQKVKASAGEEKTNTNYIAYPFDMKDKGLTKLTDLGEYLGRKENGKFAVMTVQFFNFSEQSWVVGSYLEFLDKWNGGNTDLRPGTVYAMSVSKTYHDLDLVLFGKLLPPLVYDLLPKVESKTGNNYILAPFSTIQHNRRQLLGDQVSDKMTVGIPVFNEQVWSAASYLKALNRWNPTIENENPKVFLRPWMPIVITVEKPVLNWTK